MVTECPICTRLSILVPGPIHVCPRLARSTAVRAPISTSSSTTHRADLGDLQVAPRVVLGEAEAVGSDDGAVLHDDAVAEAAALAHLDPGVEQAVLTDVDLPGRGRRGDGSRSALRSAPDPITARRAHVHAFSQLRGGVHDRGRMTPGRGRGWGWSMGHRRART